MKGYSIKELVPENLGEKFIKGRLLEGTFDNIGAGIQKDVDKWSDDDNLNIHEKRLKELLIGAGGMYSDMRTVDSDEWKGGFKDPIDLTNQLATAGILRGAEFAGWLSDQTLGRLGRGVGQALRIDPRGREVLGVASQFYSPMAVRKLPGLTKGFLKTRMGQQMLNEAGFNLGMNYRSGKATVDSVKKGFKKVNQTLTEKFSKDPSKRVVNVNPIEQTIDDVVTKSPKDIRAIVKIAKQNHISLSKAEDWVNLSKRGIRPNQSLNPGTNAGLLEGDLPLNKVMGRIQKIAKDRNIPDDLTMMARRPTSVNTLQQQLVSGSTGMVQLSPRGRGESYPAYFDRIMQTSGARKEDGYWIMDEDTFRAIKSPDARREIAQMLLTQLSQGVKGSFPKSKSIMNLKMNQDLARYNKKYAARADLHHGYPSVIGIEFFLGIPYMGNVWKNQMAIATKWGNVPGQPMVDGKSNFVSLPSSIPSTKTRKWGPVTKVKYPNPAYEEALAELEKKGLKVPQHIHQIIHDSFLTNEMGQKGQKFWKKWDPIIEKNPSDATWLAAYEDFNEIIARNRAMYQEAVSQLEAIFSTNPLSNRPEKIVDMLEEYIAKGKVTIGKGIVRDKNGKLVILKEGTDTALSKKKSVEYSQDAVKYELEEALIDFKKIIREERIKQDPRFKDIVEEIEYFPKLTDAEKLRMEDLLYKIEYYHSVYIKSKDLKSAARRAWYVTGITKAAHKANLKEYYDLMQPKLFKLPKDAPRPKIDTLDKLQTSTFKDVKTNLGERYQLILDFNIHDR